VVRNISIKKKEEEVVVVKKVVECYPFHVRTRGSIWCVSRRVAWRGKKRKAKSRIHTFVLLEPLIN